MPVRGARHKAGRAAPPARSLPSAALPRLRRDRGGAGAVLRTLLVQPAAAHSAVVRRLQPALCLRSRGGRIVRHLPCRPARPCRRPSGSRLWRGGAHGRAAAQIWRAALLCRDDGGADVTPPATGGDVADSGAAASRTFMVPRLQSGCYNRDRSGHRRAFARRCSCIGASPRDPAAPESLRTSAPGDRFGRLSRHPARSGGGARRVAGARRRCLYHRRHHRSVREGAARRRRGVGDDPCLGARDREHKRLTLRVPAHT